jgi:hypothetical protein
MKGSGISSGGNFAICLLALREVETMYTSGMINARLPTIKTRCEKIDLKNFFTSCHVREYECVVAVFLGEVIVAIYTSELSTS